MNNEVTQKGEKYNRWLTCSKDDVKANVLIRTYSQVSVDDSVLPLYSYLSINQNRILLSLVITSIQSKLVEICSAAAVLSSVTY